MVEPSASQEKFLPSPPHTKHWEMPCSDKYSSHIPGGQHRDHLEQTDLPDTAVRRSLWHPVGNQKLGREKSGGEEKYSLRVKLDNAKSERVVRNTIPFTQALQTVAKALLSGENPQPNKLNIHFGL